MPRKKKYYEEEFNEEYDIYSEQGMEDLADDDAISAGELGFMRGYTEED